MEIKFVGTGGAFDCTKGNASAIVSHNETKVLIDCGYATLERLITKNLVKDLDYILITHLHGDHVGSLPTLLAYSEIHVGKELPIIFAADEHKKQIHEFLTITWEEKRAHYKPITDFPWIGHVDTYGQHVPEKQTFAYYFTEGNKIIFYSGDIGKTETIAAFFSNHPNKDITAFIDINKKDRPVHIYYKEAQEKLSGYNVYGYHCAKEDMPEDCEIQLVEDYPEFNY